MDSLDVEQLQQALISASELIIENEPYLTQVDTIIGDGDHGVGMKSGFTALGELLRRSRYDTVFDLFRSSGIELLRVMGGASGVIFGTLFIGGHEAVRDKTALSADELIEFFQRSCDSIKKRGKSDVGDKTMLDALQPAIDAMREKRAQTGDLREILAAAWEGAVEGVHRSEQMMPKAGRSKNFREKGIGYPDPGAVSVSILFEGILRYVRTIVL